MSTSECPLCIRPMDEDDQRFYPCPCKYQICMFCYNKLIESDPRCPGCRSKYAKKSEDMFVDRPIFGSNNNNDDKNNQSKKLNNRNNKSNNDNTNNKKTKTKRNDNNNNTNDNDSQIGDFNNYGYNTHNNHSHSHAHLSFDQMAEIRVRQKNLVYVVGLPVKELDEPALKSNKWFGRFGKIKKVYCNKKTMHAVRTGSFAAFITYYNQKDALSAIQGMFIILLF